MVLNKLATTVAPVPDRSGDQRLALVQRVVNSRVFHRSTRQKEFLLYIAECAVSGRLDDVSEQAIGRNVFGREKDYDPAEDNVVRAAARQLRTKLREYFETEGLAESWILEIPKGGYVPVFHPREEAQRTAESTVGEPPAVAGKRNFRALCALGLLAAFALAVAWLWQQNRALWTELRSREPVPNPLASCLEGSPTKRLTVVLEDSSVGMLANSLGKEIALEDYTARKFPTPSRGGIGGRSAILPPSVVTREDNQLYRCRTRGKIRSFRQRTSH